MKLTISVDILSIIKWRVYESDRTYMDCKCHSGYAMSLVKGAIVSFSKKRSRTPRVLQGKKYYKRMMYSHKFCGVCILPMPRVTLLIKTRCFKIIWKQCDLK